MPGVPVRTLADLLPPKAASQLTAVPMEIGPKPGRPAQHVAVANDGRAVPARRSDVMVAWRTSASRARLHESAVGLLGRGRQWAGDLPQPSARAWITGAAAAIAFGIALAVALAIG